jgi:hypothetical protein
LLFSLVMLFSFVMVGLLLCGFFGAPNEARALLAGRLCELRGAIVNGLYQYARAL